jgi:hypothetical protein
MEDGLLQGPLAHIVIQRRTGLTQEAGALRRRLGECRLTR